MAVRSQLPCQWPTTSKEVFIKKPLVYPLQLNRGNTAFTLLQRKSDALAFGQFSQSGALNGADMNENIAAPLFRCYEPVALPRIEPFNDTDMR
jgi:hypothetical protein